MKRIVTLSLVLAFLCAGTAPLAAQRTRNLKTAKIRAVDPTSRFASVRAYSDGRGVMVEWEMAAEVNNAGFYVYKLDGAGVVLASDNMILGSSESRRARTVEGEKYSFYDAEGSVASVYYVQSFGMDGRSAVSTTASVETVNDLADVGFSSSADLGRQISDSKEKSVVTASRLDVPKTVLQEKWNMNSVADASTHAWVISQLGVRIGVRNEGIYRVTKAELQAAGFDIGSDSSLWQLYREGVEQAIIVGPNADYVEFYGKGLETTETDVAMYYLIQAQTAGKRISSRVARPVAGTVTSANYQQTLLQRQRTSYLNDILNGDAENYWGNVITTSSNMTYNFTLSGVDQSSTLSTLEVKFQGYSATQHNIQVTLNGQSLAPATGSSRTPFSKLYTIPTSYLQEGANSIVFRSSTSGTDFTFFDSVNIAYARKRLASQNRVKFYTDNYKLAKIEGFGTSNVRVFDLTYEGSPVEFSNLNVVQENTTYSVRMPSDRGRVMYAVEASGLLSAASITPNDPANLKATTNAANLVIITYKDWRAQAQAWANYRTSQGFLVKVVDVSEIYDEFNYGVLDSLSIRSFLQYAKANWQIAPSYVLLLGDATYDGKNYSGSGFQNYIPTHIVNTVFIETGSDDFLADFNGDGLAEMAVGRIAARNGQTVTNALAKVTQFEASAPTPQARGVLFAHDQYDATNDYNFEQMNVNLKNQLPGNVPVTMIGRSDTYPAPNTPQSMLISSMNSGKYLINYSGHGTTGAWASTSFFWVDNIQSLTNSSNQSIYTMLTCLNGYFLQTVNKSLAEALVEATNGGGVAAWASTGETTPADQQLMATRFYQRINGGNIERLGDLINDAKTVIPGGTDVRLSWALIGDPMLKVRSASTGDKTAVR